MYDNSRSIDNARFRAMFEDFRQRYVSCINMTAESKRSKTLIELKNIFEEIKEIKEKVNKLAK